MTWLQKVRANEPLRTTIYPLIIVLFGSLYASGTLDPDVGALIITVIGIILGVGTVETTRQNVTPYIGKHARTE